MYRTTDSTVDWTVQRGCISNLHSDKHAAVRFTAHGVRCHQLVLAHAPDANLGTYFGYVIVADPDERPVLDLQIIIIIITDAHERRVLDYSNHENMEYPPTQV